MSNLFIDKDRKNQGLTAIEMIIVITIITLIAGAILVIINPAKRIGQTQDVQRWADINKILGKVINYTIDNNGAVIHCDNLGTTVPADGVWRSIATAVSSDYTQDPDCIGVWLMDEDVDPTLDSCVNNYDGYDLSKSGDTEFSQSGYLDGAFEFFGVDGVNTDKLVNSNATPHYYDQLTITMWINPNQVQDILRNLIIKYSTFTLRTTSARRLQYYAIKSDGSNAQDSAGNQSITSYPNKIEAGKWQHMAVVQDGQMVKFYFDGEFEAIRYFNHSTEGFDSFYQSTNKLAIGANPGAGVAGPHNHYDGLIDEVGLFSVALTEDQIKEIYEYGLEGLGPEVDYCDLGPDLANYITELPEDPTTGDLEETGVTGYEIMRDNQAVIYIRAPGKSEYSEGDIKVDSR